MEIPTPEIICRADTPENADGHSAICPICRQECNVVVSDVPYLDETGVQKGFTSNYDLSAYENHYTTEHPDGS